MLQIAKILKSNGTDGGVLAGLHGISAREIELSEPVFIIFDGLPVPFFIENIQAKGTSKAVIHLTDVHTLEDAEELVGKAVYAEGEEEDEGEEDFEGWTIYDRERLLGTVTGCEPIPGNYCLYVGGTMIPLHEDFILEMDEQERILRMSLPEGLCSL